MGPALAQSPGSASLELWHTYPADSPQETLLIDAVRNEYDLHRRIHAWFARSEAGDDVEALNERVYDELFLTPSSDPWLGLVPSDAYSALDGGGFRQSEVEANKGTSARMRAR